MAAAVLLSGCGARTVLREPSDGGDLPDAPVVVDRPAVVDVPAVPDRPVAPDVPVVPDVPVTCADFQTFCNGRCVDTQNDPSHCGGCGSVCSPGQLCLGGRCIIECGGPGRTLCGRTCVDLSSDPANCGACGLACPPGATCSGGRCEAACFGPGQMLCDGVCVDVRSDSLNCAACRRSCPPGLTCSDARCVMPRPLTGTPFRIQSLGTMCRAIEHSAVTGDDRGGIAVSLSGVFYTGDSSTGRFDLDSLSGVPLGRVDDGLVSDLATGQVYSLRSRGRPVGMTGEGDLITELALVDGVTGALDGRMLPLSREIELRGDVGIFAGYGRVAFHDGTRAWQVELPSGVVTELGPVSLAPRTSSCESWAYWGVVEFFEGALHLTYVRDMRTIVRTRIPDGVTTTVGAFRSLSDMCSFTVSPQRRRWYWHHEGGSQFRSGDESIGFCDASLAVGDVDAP